MVTVNVLDVNNHAPFFDIKEYPLQVKENVVNVTVSTIKATDEDSDSVSCYTLESGELKNITDICEVINVETAL